MARAVIVIRGQADRQRAISWASQAPGGTRIEFKETKRTLPQNDHMWALLTDIASQLTWYGQKMAPDDWKKVFLDSLNREIRAVPNLDGTGFVNLGNSSSDLSKGEMSDLIEIILKFGAEQDVKFNNSSMESAQPVEAAGGDVHPEQSSSAPEAVS